MVVLLLRCDKNWQVWLHQLKYIRWNLCTLGTILADFSLSHTRLKSSGFSKMRSTWILSGMKYSLFLHTSAATSMTRTHLRWTSKTMKMHMETRNWSQWFGVNLRLISIKTLVTYACLMHDDGNGLVFNFIHTAIGVCDAFNGRMCWKINTQTHTRTSAQTHIQNVVLKLKLIIN